MPQCPVCASYDFRHAGYDTHCPPRGPRERVRRMLRSVLGQLPTGLPLPLPPSLMPWLGSPFKGRVCVCTACGHGVMEHAPDTASLERYYSSRYWTERPTPDGSGHLRGAERAAAQLEMVLSCREGELPRNSLEIGAGWAGATLRLQELAGPGFSASVCEPGQHWLPHYQAHGIERLAAFFPFVTERRFEHIHTSHWLEHVADLRATRQALVDMLAPGGTLFVEVPNCGGDYWSLPLEDSPHIHFFTGKSLRQTFEGAGLTCLHGSQAGESLRRRALGAGQERPGDEGIWLRFVFRKPA